MLNGTVQEESDSETQFICKKDENNIHRLGSCNDKI
jgi:hypothetical protein